MGNSTRRLICQNHRPYPDRAVSEILGTVVLVGIIAMVIAFVAVTVFSQPPPQKVPALNARISTNAQTVEIEHNGGDTISFGDIQILLDGVDKTAGFDLEGATGVTDWAAGRTWAVGQALTYDLPLSEPVPSSVIVVYTAGSGSQILVSSGEGASGSLAVPAPVVTGITPSTGSVGGVVPITDIAGTYFFNGASVRLSRAGSPDIPASNVVVVSSTQITCNFDLTGVSPGGVAWDVVVTNPGGPSGTLPRGFTIALISPVAGFTGTPLSGKAPLRVDFTDSSTNFPDTWSWAFGDGNTAVLQNPNNTYTTPGNYSVSLTVTNAAGSSNLTRTDYITVSPMDPPVANFTGSPRTGGVPLAVTFTDTSTNNPASWNWTFVHAYGYLNHGYSNEQNPAFTFVNAGNYSVQLTVSNAGGSNTSLKEGYIFAYVPAVANFTAANATTGPKPLTVYFTDLSTGSPSSYYWQFGDFATVNTSTATDPGHTYDTVGLYSVNLTVANAYSSSYLLRSDYINVTPTPPVAHILANKTSGNAPLAVYFRDLSSNTPTSWIWSYGDGTPDVYTKNDNHTFMSPGIYNVSHTATNLGGSSTAYQIISVYGTPTFTSITPTAGPAAGGQSVIIYGTNFAGATSVTFGGTQNTTPMTVTSTSITLTTPAHAPGTVDVVITTPGGSVTAPGAYRYAGMPTFSSLSPSPGPLVGGQSVTIIGTNFTGTSSVTIAGTQNATPMTVTDTSITLSTPSYTSAGAVNVVITSPGGSVTATGAYRYYAIQTFTASTTWAVPANVYYVEYLVVAGGGGGGRYGGGGGAGGFLTGTLTGLSGPQTVSIGGGGAGGTVGLGSNGGNSSFANTTLGNGINAKGGGGGAGNNNIIASGGGSGGGAFRTTGTVGSGISGQGFAGGKGFTYQTSRYNGGGGGGAGAVGDASTASTDGGVGGAGTYSAISGTNTAYAGGGGGGGRGAAGAGGVGGGGAGRTNAIGTAGSANTGGGGGGGGYTYNGGAGGSGIVIIKYY